MSTPAVTSRPAFRPGTIIRARRRLWRVDRHEGDELLATTIDGGETEQHRLYLGLDPTGQPFEYIEPARLDLPDPTRVGYPAAQPATQPRDSHQLSIGASGPGVGRAACTPGDL